MRTSSHPVPSTSPLPSSSSPRPLPRLIFFPFGFLRVAGTGGWAERCERGACGAQWSENDVKGTEILQGNAVLVVKVFESSSEDARGILLSGNDERRDDGGVEEPAPGQEARVALLALLARDPKVLKVIVVVVAPRLFHAELRVVLGDGDASEPLAKLDGLRVPLDDEVATAL